VRRRTQPTENLRESPSAGEKETDVHLFVYAEDNAIAEPRRRAIIGALAAVKGQRDVSWLVDKLGWPQPQVSKHLGVLRKVRLVSVVREGKRRMYSLNGEELRPVYEWVKTYERFWTHQLQRIKDRAEQMTRESKTDDRQDQT
jgi:DNA-binding transcriptional ArsR family regulator